jgi:hypothetical protein
MKRVLRSCLDPLPRFLSTRGILLVVGLVVAGTAVSVHEYLESDRGPANGWSNAGSVHAADSGARAPARPFAGCDTRGDAPCSVLPPAPRRVTESGVEPRPTPPTLYDPTSTSSGS